MHYTNASAILPDDVQDSEELDGLFSGWDPTSARYDPDSWFFQRARPPTAKPAPDAAQDWGPLEGQRQTRHRRGRLRSRSDARASPLCVPGPEETLRPVHPRDGRAVSAASPKERFLEIAEAYCSASGPEKTGAICYALGWTQHSTGVQIIRSAAILQLLLGNIGRPGGGIMALRGHASIQGSTDIPTLFDILPGYLAMPRFGPDSSTLAAYVNRYRDRTGWWSNFDKYIVSLLKAYYGDAATTENDWGFGWLPRVTAITHIRATGST